MERSVASQFMMSHDTSLPQQLNGISILNTSAGQVYPAGSGWPDEPVYQLGVKYFRRGNGLTGLATDRGMKSLFYG